VKVTYLLFDVHYYLGGWKPLWKEDKHSAHIVGGKFYNVPGKYKLPCNEGWWSLDGRGRILFVARGSSHHYNHPNVDYLDPCTVVDFGWYKIIYDFCTVTKLHTEMHRLKNCLPTGYTTNCSVQTKMIDDYLSTDLRHATKA